MKHTITRAATAVFVTALCLTALAVDPTAPQNIDSTSSTSTTSPPTTSPPAVVVPATIAPPVVVDLPAPTTTSTTVAQEVAQVAQDEPQAVEVAQVAPEPVEATTVAPAPACPRDGTVYDVGSCEVQAGTMPGDPTWTQAKVCAGDNHESPADFPCDYDPATWTCSTTDYHYCTPPTDG